MKHLPCSLFLSSFARAPLLPRLLKVVDRLPVAAVPVDVAREIRECSQVMSRFTPGQQLAIAAVVMRAGVHKVDSLLKKGGA